LFKTYFYFVFAVTLEQNRLKQRVFFRLFSVYDAFYFLFGYFQGILILWTIKPGIGSTG